MVKGPHKSYCLAGLVRPILVELGLIILTVSVGLISTIRLDLTFNQTSWSSPVFRGPLRTLRLVVGRLLGLA